MIELIKKLCKKYEELIAYLIVGVLTTIVSLSAKFLFNFFVYDNTLYPTVFETSVLSIVNWTSGVAFSYPVSRKFVFKTHGPWVPECAKFLGSRLSTFFLDLFITEVCGPALKINVFWTTFISAVLVTIANYIFSKLLVFTKKDEVKKDEAKKPE